MAKSCRPSANESLREHMLEAARTLFVTEGYDRVSMRKIAARIGYTPTTIYLYFTNKSEILHCLAEEMYQKLFHAFERARQKELSPVAALKRILDACVDFGLEDPDRYRIGFMVATDLWPERADQMRKDSIALRVYTALLDLVRAVMKDKRPSRMEVEAAAQSVWAAVHGLTSLLLTYASFPWAHKEALKDKVVEVAVAGITY